MVITGCERSPFIPQRRLRVLEIANRETILHRLQRAVIKSRHENIPCLASIEPILSPCAGDRQPSSNTVNRHKVLSGFLGSLITLGNIQAEGLTPFTNNLS